MKDQPPIPRKYFNFDEEYAFRHSVVKILQHEAMSLFRMSATDRKRLNGNIVSYLRNYGTRMTEMGIVASSVWKVLNARRNEKLDGRLLSLQGIERKLTRSLEEPQTAPTVEEKELEDGVEDLPTSPRLAAFRAKIALES